MPVDKSDNLIPPNDKKVSEIEAVLENPWDNVYWFLRMLIASDKYAGVGGDSNTMLALAKTIRLLIKSSEEDADLPQTLMRGVRDVLTGRWSVGKKASSVRLLCDDLSEKLVSIEDFKVLAFTCEKVLVPINESLKGIPSDDREFAHAVAKALLTAKRETGIATVINLWDDVGTHGCLSAERSEVVRIYRNLDLSLKPIAEQDDKDIVLTAFCQEFERRLGQKRKGRAGRSVESVTSLILDHFKIKGSPAPEHFTTGLEIDKWVRTGDGWLIGISCKRTLRERWKQAYTTDLDLLNRHKIKALWHVVTYDRDLSDDKLTEMGSYRAVFYLPDQSERYRTASSHAGMKKYVRKLSNFVKDLRTETASQK